MKRLVIIAGLLLTSSLALAGKPSTDSQSEKDLKAMLRRLVPEEPEEEEATAATEAVMPTAKKTSAKKATVTTIKDLEKTKSASSRDVAASAIPFALGLFLAFGFFTYTNRKKKDGQRAIRRIAVEPLGAKQNIMLVEALGEYLLLATGGRETVLLAQLDTEQAKAKLAALEVKQAAAPKTQTSWTARTGKLLARFTPNRLPDFDEILEEAPINIESQAPKKKPSTQSPAKLALAQASFRALNSEVPTKKKSLNERLADLAGEDDGAPPSREDRADAIRRRLASL